MTYTDLDKTESYAKLKVLAGEFAGKETFQKLDAERVAEYSAPMACGLTYNYAAKKLNGAVIDALEALAREIDAVGKYKLILDGEIMNTGENRKVLHHLARGRLGKEVFFENKNIGDFYKKELERFSTFASAVREGKINPGAGKKFTTAVQIGIGGSDLGPRALYIALENWARKEGKAKITAKFISNVDPDDAAAVLSSIDLTTSLFVLVSKSGTTQETLANELFVKDKLKKAGLDPAKHIVAVTSETSPLAHNPAYLDSFYIDDFIGGRYSASSAVGGVILSLAFGPETFAGILAGSHEADKTALEPSIRKNPALLDALTGVWERNFLNYPYTAILPYSQALSRFPAHLQQLDMESNGKCVNRFGNRLSYATGPVIFGEPGTNGQHSFYQLLHQGTDITPVQFIGFKESQLNDDVNVDGSNSQTKLKANLAAQIVAFAKGKQDSNPNKNFEGGRPSSIIYGKRLTPETLGALLAHYENKVMFQGFIWNLNSFDQEGVQLGKILTKKVLAGGGDLDGALDAYSKILGVK
ncbi:MAG: glucose-6-phosphate isomerase [Spirochaetaceae bacterium]|jgi:glucose-6-phosphate isomerase|nr:glucose-6-phosphate isomerase [Spirochaetaceae bacterium]